MSHPVDVHIGKKLKLARLVRKISLVAVGDHLEVSFQQIQKYENGTNRIPASRLFELGNLLDVPMSYFFDGLHDNHDRAPQSDIGTDIAKKVGRLKDERTKKHILDFIADVSGLMTAKTG